MALEPLYSLLAPPPASHPTPLICGHLDNSVGKEIRLQCRRPWLSWVGKICWRRDRLPTPGFLGFPCDSAGKDSTCNAGDLGSIPGLERSPGEEKGYPLQYSGLVNSMDHIYLSHQPGQLLPALATPPVLSPLHLYPRHLPVPPHRLQPLQHLQDLMGDLSLLPPTNAPGGLQRVCVATRGQQSPGWVQPVVFQRPECGFLKFQDSGNCTLTFLSGIWRQ